MPKLKIIGRRPVLEALEANLPLLTIYISGSSKENMPKKVTALAEKHRVTIKYIPKNHLDKLAGPGNHQGIVAEMTAPPALSLEDLLQKIGDKASPAIALLDGIEDPRNLGAILRVADGAGIDGVVIPKRRSASLSPGAIKASAGAVFHMPVAEVPNIARAIEQLKAENYWIVGTEMAQEKLPWQMDLSMPVAIVLGSEGKGLRRLVREKCDFLVSLPMHGKVDSLNVATAAAVLFYERVRQLAP